MYCWSCGRPTGPPFGSGSVPWRRQIANVSHDLRTPLTSILGYLQLLEDEALPAAERREYLAVVASRAKALQSLITSFYDLSRLESGEYPLRREKVDLYTSLSGLLAAFYNDFTDAGFDVTVDLAQGLPGVTADPSGVLRVFTNLLRNALDHGQGQMEVRLFRKGDAVVSLFRNGSGGITQDDIPHVFDRFFTADKMRTGRNTGLGLAIVKALADQMGCGLEAGLVGAFFFRAHPMEAVSPPRLWEAYGNGEKRSGVPCVLDKNLL